VDPKHLKTLELDKILDQLAGLASFSASRELLLSLQPETSLARVQALQAATAEASRLLASRPSVSIGAAKDVRPIVSRAGLGAILQPAELLEVLGTIEAGRALHELLHRGQLVYPQLATFAGRLHALPALRQEIAETINDRAEVVDSASPALARLRVEVRSGRDRIMRRLEGIINDPNNAEAIQEPIVTERNGRYVLAVKAGYRHHIRGVIHDQSESGATLFLEPLVTVDMTNDWRQSQLEEQREVERILRVLSGRVALEAKELDELVQALAALDATFAKARLADRLQATEPELNAQGVVDLIEARHPLLGESAVPQTIRLGEGYRVLVITGPNTGGKTVALKTVGLLTLMAQCGLRIPAASGSKVCVFEQVLADIGDEQSIEQSLSTFSGHLKTIVAMLRQAGSKALLLLDELGAGTDPDEGSALAEAVLDYLLARGVSTVATTHYSALKTFAQQREAVENASVEFDLRTLSPTYRLRIGTPGRSNAFAIASRLGLPEEIIERARGGLSTEHLRAESLLDDIQRKERLAARERNRASREQQQLRRLRLEAEEALVEAERLREEARETALAQAEAELADVRREVARVAQRLARARQAPAELRQLREEVAQSAAKLEQRRPARPATATAQPVKVGDFVHVPGFSGPAQVLSTANAKGEVEVQAGPFRVRTPASGLVRAQRPRRREEGATFQPASISGPVHSLGTPLDLRGVRADEVEPLLDRELNEAFSAGVGFLKIIHGHGSGIVRRLVRDYLAQQPYVSGFEPASAAEGGDGVTIVTLAMR